LIGQSRPLVGNVKIAKSAVIQRVAQLTEVVWIAAILVVGVVAAGMTCWNLLFHS
jgi:hypothetical protein